MRRKRSVIPGAAAAKFKGQLCEELVGRGRHRWKCEFKARMFVGGKHYCLRHYNSIVMEKNNG